MCHQMCMSQPPYVKTEVGLLRDHSQHYTITGMTKWLERLTFLVLIWVEKESFKRQKDLTCTNINNKLIFTALSVKRVLCDKMEERSVQIFISHERTCSLVFWEKEWLVATPCTWNFGSTDPRWSNIAYFEPIIARSASS